MTGTGLEGQACDKGRKGRLANAFLTGFQVAVLLCLLFLAWHAMRGVPLVMHVQGASMEPGMHDGESYLCLDAWSPGDAVALQDPTRDRLLVKRAAAVGPCHVRTDSMGTLYINGTKADEPWALHGPEGSCAESEWDVLDGQVFVLGDNRADSYDSRSFGPVDAGLVKCRAGSRLPAWLAALLPQEGGWR